MENAAKKYCDWKIKAQWCFWNIVIALFPVFVWFALVKNPVDLWNGTFSCACALSGSVAFASICGNPRDFGPKITSYVAIFLAGLFCIVLLFAFKEARIVTMVFVDFWYASYFVFSIVLFRVIYVTFKDEFDTIARQRDRYLTMLKQQEEEATIQKIAQKSTEININ